MPQDPRPYGLAWWSHLAKGKPVDLDKLILHKHTFKLYRIGADTIFECESCPFAFTEPKRSK